MARVPSLEGLPSEAVCQKPQCGVADRLQRHHRGQESLWLGNFSGERSHTKRYKTLLKRYNEFRIEDTVLICDCHHAEVHLLYDQIIQAEKDRLGKPLHRFTWAEAEILMEKLREACDYWLTKVTPGLEPEELRRKRFWRPPTKLRR